MPAVTQVLVRPEGVLGRLTLNRPEALNALDPAMIRALAAALAVWEHEDEVRAVLLDGDARIARYPKPYVALMDGLVMGAASGSPPTAASAWSPSGPRSSCPRPPSATCPTSAAPTCSPDTGGTGHPRGADRARLTGADAIACRLADLLVPAPRLPHLVAALATSGDPATVAQFALDPGPSPLLARPG